MNAPLVLDYSFARPDPRTIKAQGYVGVMRYIGGSASKQLTAAEAQHLHAQGLWVGLVWEGAADRAGLGSMAGRADAQAAEAAADRLGYPMDAVIFYAVDFDATPDRVRPYFDAVRAAARRPVGIYGGIKVTSAGLAPYRWQAAAWSSGQLDQAGHLYQRIKPTHPIPGTDENALLHAFPAWQPPGSKPKPVPPVSNHVTRGRGLITKGLAELAAARIGGKPRPAVRAMAAAIRAALRIGPKS